VSPHCIRHAAGNCSGRARIGRTHYYKILYCAAGADERKYGRSRVFHSGKTAAKRFLYRRRANERTEGRAGGRLMRGGGPSRSYCDALYITRIEWDVSGAADVRRKIPLGCGGVVCGCVCVTLFSSYRRRCCGTRLTQNIVLSGRPSYRRRRGGVREDDISFRPPTPPRRPSDRKVIIIHIGPGASGH